MSKLTDLYAAAREAGRSHYGALRELAHRLDVDQDTVARTLKRSAVESVSAQALSVSFPGGTGGAPIPSSPTTQEVDDREL